MSLSSHHIWLRAVPVCLVCFLLTGCGDRQIQQSPETASSGAANWNHSAAETQYRLVLAELLLARSEKLYMVINFEKSEVRLKLKGAVVWDYPLVIAAEDSEDVEQFFRRFQGNEEQPIRAVGGKHLFSGRGKSPDSVLAVVGEALRVDPELLQREVPAKFQIRWGSGLIVEVNTDISGKPKSLLKNTIVTIRQVMNRPFGEAHIVIKMDPEAALTLYSAVQRGLPTIVYPP